jgi:hypothetical protein
MGEASIPLDERERMPDNDRKQGQQQDDRNRKNPPQKSGTDQTDRDRRDENERKPQR